MLKGKKVNLRAVCKLDVKCFIRWLNDQEVTQYLIRYYPLTEMEEEKWIDRLAEKKDNATFTIETIEDRKVIGNCDLHILDNKDRHAVFGIVIGEKEYWSKGCGTETLQLIVEYGFNQLNLNRISSSAFTFNERSVRMHKKAGFREEGCRRKVFFKNGEFCDEIIFGLLREDWRK